MFQDIRFKTDPIQWHEGMPLTPQHFQLNDKRIQSIFSNHLNLFSPFNFGVLEIQHDSIALSNGIFKIVQLTAIMPDGFLVQYKENRQSPALEIDISGLDFSLSTNKHKIYLCLPIYYSGEPSAAGNHPRYISVEGDMIIDENGSFSDATRIPRLAPNLHLVAGKDPSSRFISLPIAEIQKDDGRIITTQYIPPSLSLPANHLLTKICRDIATAIRQKISHLSDQYDPMSDNPNDEQSRTAINTLLTAILPFESMTFVPGQHPYTYYCALVELAAKISVLRLDATEGAVFSTFNQLNAGFCFREVSDFINSILKNLGEHVEKRLFQQKQGYFGTHIPFIWKTPKLLVGARINSQATQSDTYAWIQNAIIGSQSTIRSLTDRRVIGATRNLIQGDTEHLIRVSKDIILFAIDLETEFVKKGEVLYIYNPSDKRSTRPLELYLYVTNKDI